MKNNVHELCFTAREGGRILSRSSADQKNEMLSVIADSLIESSAIILAGNKRDLDAFSGADSLRDRLTLTPERISAMAEGIRQVIALPDPVGEVMESFVGDKGIKISKVRVPLGVIGVIYEARPNVTADVVALTLKSGNAVVLRGGKEAVNTNKAIYKAMVDGLTSKGFTADFIQFIDDVSRESTGELLRQDKLVDVIIPRGGEGLKRFVLENSTIPVIASSGGICHTYVDESADLEMAKRIVKNAKLQRPSVCNALECLIVHKAVAEEFLSVLLPEMAEEKGLIAYGDAESATYNSKIIVSDPCVYDNEYFGYEMSVKVVGSVTEAIEHVNAHNTRHSEAIVSSNPDAIEKFKREVDAACVYANASTRFTDGFEFGFGAEIAISTQKLHARGPLGLKELTSYKYLIDGEGQIRG